MKLKSMFWRCFLLNRIPVFFFPDDRAQFLDSMNESWKSSWTQQTETFRFVMCLTIGLQSMKLTVTQIEATLLCVMFSSVHCCDSKICNVVIMFVVHRWMFDHDFARRPGLPQRFVVVTGLVIIPSFQTAAVLESCTNPGDVLWSVVKNGKLDQHDSVWFTAS